MSTHRGSALASWRAQRLSKDGNSSTVAAVKPRAKNVVGNFSLGKTLGEGTFGEVKLAIHIKTEEKVAAKVLEKKRINSIADVKRVSREIRILKKVRHDNTIHLYEVVDTPTAIYFITENCDGGELFDFIVRHTKLLEPQACFFFRQLVEGVSYLHSQDITHRDLKPENLLLQSSPHGWRLKIIDFGLSNTHEGGRLLQTACGSPCYAAPEMIAGERYIGPMVDVWSMGVVLFTLVAGYLPFEDPNTGALYKKILSGSYQCPKWVSTECRDLLRVILNTDPELRADVDRIRLHPWFRKADVMPSPPSIFPTSVDEVDQDVLAQMRTLGFNTEDVSARLLSARHDDASTTYYLLLRKALREKELREAGVAVQEAGATHDRESKTAQAAASISQHLDKPASAVSVSSSNPTVAESAAAAAAAALITGDGEILSSRESMSPPPGSSPLLKGEGALKPGLHTFPVVEQKDAAKDAKEDERANRRRSEMPAPMNVTPIGGGIKPAIARLKVQGPGGTPFAPKGLASITENGGGAGGISSAGIPAIVGINLDANSHSKGGPGGSANIHPPTSTTVTPIQAHVHTNVRATVNLGSKPKESSTAFNLISPKLPATKINMNTTQQQKTDGGKLLSGPMKSDVGLNPNAMPIGGGTQPRRASGSQNANGPSPLRIATPPQEAPRTVASWSPRVLRGSVVPSGTVLLKEENSSTGDAHAQTEETKLIGQTAQLNISSGQTAAVVSTNTAAISGTTSSAKSEEIRNGLTTGRHRRSNEGQPTQPGNASNTVVTLVPQRPSFRKVKPIGITTTNRPEHAVHVPTDTGQGNGA